MLDASVCNYILVANLPWKDQCCNIMGSTAPRDRCFHVEEPPKPKPTPTPTPTPHRDTSQPVSTDEKIALLLKKKMQSETPKPDELTQAQANCFWTNYPYVAKTYQDQGLPLNIMTATYAYKDHKSRGENPDINNCNFMIL